MHGAVGKAPSWVHPGPFRRGLNQRSTRYLSAVEARDGSRTILSSGFIPICISKYCFSDVGVVSKGFLSRCGLVSCDGGGFLLWLKRGGGSLPPVHAQVSVYRVLVGFLRFASATFAWSEKPCRLWLGLFCLSRVSSFCGRLYVLLIESVGAHLARRPGLRMEAFIPRFVFIATRLVLRLVVQGLSWPFTVPPSHVLAVSEARMASYRSSKPATPVMAREDRHPRKRGKPHILVVSINELDVLFVGFGFTVRLLSPAVDQFLRSSSGSASWKRRFSQRRLRRFLSPGDDVFMESFSPAPLDLRFSSSLSDCLSLRSSVD
ncbi:hypothetical protein YC2023_045606 [Brassica napus]